MGGVIKAGDPTGRTLGAEGVAFNLVDVRDQAGAYLETVRGQAAEIIAAAEKKAAEIQKKATVAGKAAAQQAAQKEAQAAADAKLQQQLGTLLPALQTLIVEVNQQRNQWRSQWEKQVIELASAIAERVIRREIADQPQITLDLLREALELASSGGKVQVLLNPADHAALGDAATLLAKQFSKIGAAEVQSSESVGPGGCVLKTDHGEIDQQIETQLRRIEEELNG